MTQVDRALLSSASGASVPSSVCAAGRTRGRAAVADVVELTKPRITKMVLVTTGVGFALPALARPWGGVELAVTALACVVGTALSASGSSALNQWMERERDGAMHRTRNRPLPAGRMTARAALLVGLASSLLGVLTLALLVNTAAAAVSLATIVTYLLVYTPLKPVTPLATLVGAVPGALPPLIGWAAAAGGSEAAAWASLGQAGGWSLFLIMLVWQIPHFLAIAWMHRADYARGGYRVLPVVDPTGERTSWSALMWAVALVPVSLAPVRLLPVSLGWGYVVVAAGAGGLFTLAVARFAWSRSDAHARAAFFASIIYLPLVLVAMVADAGVAAIR